MIKYICKNCNLPSETSVCANCGERTEISDTGIFWCKSCNIPLYEDVCSLCGSSCKKIGTDLRPVFPEERLLFETIIGEPLKYKNSSVWAIPGHGYVVDGKKIAFSTSNTKNLNADEIRKTVNDYSGQNDYEAFEKYADKFVAANRNRYDSMTQEAMEYINSVASGYDAGEMFVSFSGGKDSTVTSDLAMRALGNSGLCHIYGNTTLEFPTSLEYVERFKKDHHKVFFAVAKNKDKNFDDLCEQLGPPSRVMRWCCTIFKTGAIQRKITQLFKDKKRILTFYGIRRSESASRSKYERDTEGAKITKQLTASPIIDWLDFDVWLYILTTKIDFNAAYRLGFTRVGCWCCPNNGVWSEFLSKIYMPEQYEKWHTFLVDFARKIGKPDPEDYVEDGSWKARQGGNGVAYSQTSVVTFEPCALQENTLNFELQKPISEELYELFKPFGKLNTVMGNERLGEVYVIGLDGTPYLKLQGKIGTTTLKVSVLSSKAGHSSSIKAVQEKVKCQITKYQMCMGCLACQAVCRHNAIDMQVDAEGLKSYKIRDDKCVRCGECINHFNGGCYIRKVLTIKRNNGDNNG